jgi:hypothetical protein
MILVGKPEGKILLRRPRSRWEDNIKLDLMGIVWKGIDWIGQKLSALGQTVGGLF